MKLNTRCESIVDMKLSGENSIKNKSSGLKYLSIEVWWGKMALEKIFGENEWIIHCQRWKYHYSKSISDSKNGASKLPHELGEIFNKAI